MLSTKQKNELLKMMVEALELPDSAYEKAKKRYEDMGEYLGREDSTLKDYELFIFPQGSFRLGTAIRPLSENEEYDLDLGCKLKVGISKRSYTQCDLKTMVGQELESYQIARGIKTPKKEKHRCWRLEYQDDLSFHMDIVPCIPSDKTQKNTVYQNLMNEGLNDYLATKIGDSSISITDNRDENYHEISDNWNISNPEGYAQWFVSIMKPNNTILNERAEVDKIPDYKLKTTLQRVVQLLKRHRDNMFKNDEDRKPISIIITTLVARSYKGEEDISIALTNILNDMKNHVNPNIPRVPNPVNKEEDFSDKWTIDKYRYLDLEGNFWRWLEQAQMDFKLILDSSSSKFISEQIESKFSLQLNEQKVTESVGLVVVKTFSPKEYSIKKENVATPHMDIK